jgi:hypothetical protein
MQDVVQIGMGDRLSNRTQQRHEVETAVPVVEW